MSAKTARPQGIFSHPYLLLTLTTLFWGANAVAGKIASGYIPPLTLTALRWICASSILFFMARPLLRGAIPILRRRWRYIFLCGAMGFGMFNFCLYGALNYTSAINTSIEQAGTPMIIMLLTYIFYREPITLLQGIGVFISMIGVLITVVHGDLSVLLSLDLNRGDAIMVAAVLVYSAYSVALRHKPDLPWQVFMFGLALSAAIFALPGMAYEMASGRYPAASWVTPGIMIFVVIFPSLMSQAFYVRAVGMIGANRAGQFFNLVPVFGAALAILILGEKFQLYHAVGLCMVIGGIALAETSARRRLAREGQPSAN
ncbi:MAG: DMT family transporter [Rhodobiaceae bacterium]|nr:DMT family transporter [Rhodobiaceae bacterium]MCC0048321.1 DMT family transporter [Rhodobiaceae bacterium]